MSRPMYPERTTGTQRVVASDTATLLTSGVSPALAVESATGIVTETTTGWRVVGAQIQVGDNDLRYAIKSTPTQGASQLGVKAVVGDTINLNTMEVVKDFRYINDVAAATAVLQCTLFLADKNTL